MIILTIACQQKEKQLPILGKKEVVENGASADTVYHTIPDFKFIDQDSNTVTQKTFDNKIYIADFFFTTCPTICPVMKTQMLRVYEKYNDNPEIAFLSHTIDPKHDTVGVLKEYADRLGISSDQWHMVTGARDKIFEIAQSHYMVSAHEDPSAPGGAVHSGAFILIDKQKRIRGYYDGTKEEEVNQLIEDIPLLIQTKSN
ncbi:SCO family protein [Marinoscillum luteum]|uniref:SCO family protein n=1 Tax=Marinoscillum luteum TaxID=861051 RepID=A0ABW7N8K3_9BACT